MSEYHESEIENLRREYIGGKLCSKDLPPDPLVLFTAWFEEAKQEEKIKDPSAVCVATVDGYGRPFQRTVLLKHYDEQGMVFYGNLKSRKALHLKENPYISLLFPWYALDRQVTFLGKAEPLPHDKVESYFASRPKDSQIAALVSHQSCTIANRQVLEEEFSKCQQQYQQSAVPVPDYWGGFCVCFDTVEFWQGRASRLHDRFLYQRSKEGWERNRLAP